MSAELENAIAVIGMEGIFPGSPDLETFWENIALGKECISSFDDETLRNAGISDTEFSRKAYIRRKGIIQDEDCFDADFFDMTPFEAKITDPQQRKFLECAWNALENGGYYPEGFTGSIGVFGGLSINSYLFSNIFPNEQIKETAGWYQLLIGNDKDFLSTRTAFKLNLTGPAVTVQTACSTSLVAIHNACQSLLNFECDMALAGGSSIHVPQQSGYLYQKNGILSPDGSCRPFDKLAAGTVDGNGVGLVLLKRYEDALEEGDNIRAVVRGSAINNDGNQKMAFTAPSERGQSKVIREALSVSEVEPSQIGYIEAHGTGTALGDPIEVSALKSVYKEGHNGRIPYLSSVKGNIGHLDAAAGVAGFIKTVLCLENSQIPPTLHFSTVNPELGIEKSFRIPDKLHLWNEPVRYAGISSFGIGGTNAHMVLQSNPVKSEAPRNPKREELFILSAQTKTALKQRQERLGRFLEKNPNTDHASLAFTLKAGRKAFSYRAAFRADSIEDLKNKLAKDEPTYSAQVTERDALAFLFSGQGSQYTNMAWELYQEEEYFRRIMDQGFACLQKENMDLKPLIFSQNNSDEILKQTKNSQPALFLIEYALASLLIHLGVKPKVLLGHSIGEYAAACIAGVFSFEEGLKLILSRARLMEEMPKGAMLAVFAKGEVVSPFLHDELEVALHNSEEQIVLSGTELSVLQAQEELDLAGIKYKRVNTSHAFHSFMMEGMLEDFSKALELVSWQEPQIPIISCRKGELLDFETIKNPKYWLEQLRKSVEFEKSLKTLMDSCQVLLEIGPGNTLCSFAWQIPQASNKRILSSLPSKRERDKGQKDFTSLLADLWINGLPVDWEKWRPRDPLKRIALPGYPFAKVRHWVEAPKEKEKVKENYIKDQEQVGLLDWKKEVQILWKNLLGQSRIEDTDDFFELGGNSLLAIQMISIIQSKFDISLSLGALQGKSRMGDFVNLMENTLNKGSESEILQSLNHNDQGIPLVMIHPAGGNTLVLQEIVNELSDDYRIFGLQYPQSPQDTSIKGLADQYIQELRTRFGSEGFYLCGYSFGGNVGFEISRRAEEFSLKVNALFLLDSYPPSAYLSCHYSDKTFIQDYLQSIIEISLDLDEKSRKIVCNLIQEKGELDQILMGCQEAALFPEGFSYEDVKKYITTFKENMMALPAYEPEGLLHLPVFLLQAEDQSEKVDQLGVDLNPERQLSGWECHCSREIRTFSIPGDHYSMVLGRGGEKIAEIIAMEISEKREAVKNV